MAAADLSSHLLQADLGGAQSGLAVAQADNVFLASTVRRLVRAGHGGSLSRHRLNEALRIVQRVETVDRRAAEATRDRTPVSGDSRGPTPRERSGSGGDTPIAPILVPPMEGDEERARRSMTPASTSPAEAPVRTWSSIREKGEEEGGGGGERGEGEATRPAPVRTPLAGFGSVRAPATASASHGQRPPRLGMNAARSGEEGPHTDPRRDRARARDPAPLRRLQSAVPTGSRRGDESSAHLRRSLAHRVRTAGATLSSLQRQRAKRTQSQADLLAASDGAKGAAGSAKDSGAAAGAQ